MLLVTADDFGASLGANAAIESAHRDGIVTSVSLMATGSAASDAADRTRDLPALSVGLHLVLCDGASASPPSKIPDLVDTASRFPSNPARVGIAMWLGRHRLRAQIDREIRAQIERHLATGLALDHVDGHHHLHMHPVVFELLARALEDYKVGWVRLMHEDGLARRLRVSDWIDPVPGIFRALAAVHRRRLARSGAAGAPERVYGLRATGCLEESEWLRLLPRLRAHVVEIYAHPSRDTESGRREEAALRSPAVRAAVERSDYSLVGTRACADRVRAGF
jgi:hopanoid biosynthesis associated protein HpnK